MTHGSVAKRVREHKEARPEDYCSDRRCLWNTAKSGPCPKHRPDPCRVPCSDAAGTCTEHCPHLRR